MSTASDATLRRQPSTAEKRARAPRRRLGLGAVDFSVASTWVLRGGAGPLSRLPTAVAMTRSSHSQVGIVVWWIVLLGAAAGILPRTRLTGGAWGALALFARLRRLDGAFRALVAEP